MKLLFILLFTITIKISPGQSRVFYKADDLADSLSLNNIKKIKMPLGRLGSHIQVEYNDGSKKSVRKKEIWGFQSNKKEIFRFDDGNTLILVDTNAIDIYKTWARYPVYYYSPDLKSRAIVFSKKSLLKSLGVDEYNRVCKASSLARRLSKYL